MKLIETSITRPIAVIAAVILVVLFGLMALARIPIQLTPDVNQPVITVNTNWFGASPAEIEREIVSRQEEVFKGLDGLKRIESTSRDGSGEIRLEFGVGQDLILAQQLVAQRLNRVGDYPDEATEPQIETSGSEDNPIAWFVMRAAEGNTRPIHEYGDFIEDVIADRLQRVEGVSRVNVYGGSEREIRVIIKPELMARYGLTVPDVVNALRAANISLTAGDIEEGKRRYVLRMEGRFSAPEDLRYVTLRSRVDEGSGRLARLTLDDIAEIRFGYKKAIATIRLRGELSLAMNAIRETGANVIETMEGIQAALDELNATVMPEAGLRLTQVYDETIYIDEAIALVWQNLLLGGVLAALMLFLFLRSGRSTLIISLAIPISIIGSFVAMAALGRSINVISLAGLAFAVGMVVDAAIVVLENIYRLRQEGKSAREAAYQGAEMVWGAILVSALTTVMVFVPILTLQLEVGQLFRDIAVAISVAVILSLLVAITVIPALTSRLFETLPTERKTLSLPGLDHFARGVKALILLFTQKVIRSRTACFAVVTVITLIASLAVYIFLPKLDYLPTGNRNFFFGIILPPPGYNLETVTGIADHVESVAAQRFTGDISIRPENGNKDAEVRINNFFFVAFGGQAFIGGDTDQPRRTAEIIPFLTPPLFAEPGTFGFLQQPSLFGQGIGGGRTVELDISGGDLVEILGVAQRAMALIEEALPRQNGHQMRPVPGLELGAPELRILPHRIRLADAGITTLDLAQTLDAFNDGLRVAELTVGGKQMDLTLQGPQNGLKHTQDAGEIKIVTPRGELLDLADLAQIEMTSGPTEILRKERQRTVSIIIQPSPRMALEEVIQRVEQNVIAPLRAEGVDDAIRMNVSGTADQLTETWDAMVWQLLLALVIVFLVMAVLFESFFYPLIIMITVPVAAAGGIGGLALLNLYLTPAGEAFSMTWQPLDMLTLLGFVILIGIVVNNAILLVHQTLAEYRTTRKSVRQSILAATNNRIRPIFMSTLTSILGMLPLVVFPGAGSELYRGLGSVVLGGLSLSALLTLLTIPPLMALFMAAIERREHPEYAAKVNMAE